MWPFQKKRKPFKSETPPGPVTSPRRVIVTQEELYDECFTRFDYVAPDRYDPRQDKVVRYVGRWKTTELWMEIDKKDILP